MDPVAVATLLIAALSLVVAAITLWYAVSAVRYADKTLKESVRVSRAQFFATVRGLLSPYDDIHAKLRPGGEWALEGEPKGPQTPKEVAYVDLYMGLFEYCGRLLEQGLLAQSDFDRNLLYRLKNIVANRSIMEPRFGSTRERAREWDDFKRLCERCGLGDRIPKLDDGSQS